MIILIEEVRDLVEEIKKINKYCKSILTSIGGSPIHEGHTELLLECKIKCIQHVYKFNREWANDCYFDKEDLILMVLVNSNNFLLNKHGYIFQDEKSRAKIIDSIKEVDYTFLYDTDDTIEEAIKILKPDFLCKGGDRTEETMAQVEKDACLEVGCEILYGVGGGKVQSSSALLNEWRKGMDEEENFRSMLHAGI